MDIETIIRQLKNNRSENLKKAKIWYKAVLSVYNSLPLNLPITDESMKRVCQVLTNFGYKTSESCEGHGKELPGIFFNCDDKISMRDITHIISRELPNT